MHTSRTWHFALVIALTLFSFLAPSNSSADSWGWYDSEKPADVKASAYADSPGKSVYNFLGEVFNHHEHYKNQARKFENIDFWLRVTAFFAAMSSALVLVLTEKEWARRAAIIASLLAAAIPAGDQIFKVNTTLSSTWRAKIGLAKLHSNCKDSWELDTSSNTKAVDVRSKAASDLISKCRKEMFEFIEQERAASDKPLVIPQAASR